MKPGIRFLLQLALGMGLCLPVAIAQKPPAPPPPAPPPPSGSPGNNPTNQPGLPNSNNPQPGVLRQDLIMFLLGRVTTSDGTRLPTDAKVERLCNGRVRQQVFADSRGEFSMQLGSMTDSFVDASADGTSPSSLNRFGDQGIPRQELSNCELRASVSGFQSDVINLVDLHDFGNTIDIGKIVVQRREKIAGNAVSAVLYNAPKDARKNYEHGIDAERKQQFAEAQQYFEKAVKVYPKFTNAWFQLGTVLLKQKQTTEARNAFTQATAIDAKYLPPFLSLSMMAYQTENWPEVLLLTGHILELDTLNYAHVPGYILDLDPLDYAEAYFYNAVANFSLNKIDAAEKSGLKAEYLDVRPRFPRLHLLLAEIYARKNNYARAISEAQTYLDLMPNANDADKVRQRLEELKKLSGNA